MEEPSSARVSVETQTEGQPEDVQGEVWTTEARVEELLQGLHPERPYTARREALDRLGELSEGSPRIMALLAELSERDPHPRIREAAARLLLPPAARATEPQGPPAGPPPAVQGAGKENREDKEKKGFLVGRRKKPAPVRNPLSDVPQMRSAVRSWATVSLLTGAASLLFSGTLDPVWGIMLIVLALLSWKITIPALFVVHAVIMGWAALMNGMAVLTGGEGQWLLLALMQVAWVASLLDRFRRYSYLSLWELYEAGSWPPNLAPPLKDSLVTGRFAVVSAVVGALAAVLLPCVFFGGVALIVLTSDGSPGTGSRILDRVSNGVVDLAVVALGLGCAAAVSRNARRGWAIAGVVMNALVLLGWLILLLVLNAR